MIHGALFFVEAAFWSSGGVEMLEDAKEKKWGELIWLIIKQLMAFARLDIVMNFPDV